MEILNKLIQLMSDHSGVIMTVLGVLWAIAKRVSNAKAGPVIHKLQAGLDLVAKVALAVGELAKKASEMLAEVIKSDGVLGKK